MKTESRLQIHAERSRVRSLDSVFIQAWSLDSVFINLVQDFTSQVLQPKFVLLVTPHCWMVAKGCAQHGARTHDPEIKSLMLYRLSQPGCVCTERRLDQQRSRQQTVQRGAELAEITFHKSCSSFVLLHGAKQGKIDTSWRAQ